MDCVSIRQAPQHACAHISVVCRTKTVSKLNKHLIESVKKMSNFIALIFQCVSFFIRRLLCDFNENVPSCILQPERLRVLLDVQEGERDRKRQTHTQRERERDSET